MPHFITEYSGNLEDDIDLPGLFEKVHRILGETGVFPLGGIRSRAVKAETYRIADAAHDYGFVHMTLKVGSGRPLEVRRQAGDALFETIKAHFAPIQEKRLLAISFELAELHPDLNYKHNNIHSFLKQQSEQ